MVPCAVRLGSVAFALALLSLVVADGPATKKLLTVEDLYLFDAPRSAALAPDGNSVSFVRHFLDKRARAERLSLWRREHSHSR